MELISKEAIDKSGFSAENAKSYGAGAGLLMAGMFGGQIITTLIPGEHGKKLPVNAGLAVGGFVGAMYVKNPMLKFGLLGLSVYGTLRTVAIATKGLQGVDGLGFLPEAVKSKIAQFIPTIGSVEELLGAEELLGNTNKEVDALLLNLGLDEAPVKTEDAEFEIIEEGKPTNGIGQNCL